MAQAFKQRFARMNLDADVRSLQPGEVRLLVNAITKQANNSATNNENIVTSLYGHAIVTNADIQTGEKTLAGLEDKVGNRLFFFNYHSGGSDTIYAYNYAAGTISKVLRTTLFAWAATDFVSADIVGDILVFTANNGAIWKINVATALASGYTPTSTELKLIKRAPQRMLSGVTGTSGLVSPNRIYQHSFQFYYQYIYDDKEPSVFSAVSETVRGVTSTENMITVTVSASETIPTTVRQINCAVRVDGANELVVYKRLFPTAGVLSSQDHTFFNDAYLETVPDPQFVKWVDAVPRQTKALNIFKNRLFLFNNVEGYDYASSLVPPITTTSGPTSIPGAVGLPCYKDGASYNFGIMFWDTDGRHAGVHTNDSVAGLGSRIVIPDDRLWTVAAPYIVTVNLTGVTSAYIPTWATHYSVVRTNCNISFFIQHIGVPTYYTRDDDGAYVYNTAYASTREGLAFDITAFIRAGLGYTYSEGDRMKVYYSGAAPPVDLEIKGQAGKYIYTGLFDLGSLAGAANFAIEPYTPTAVGQDIFYEVGNKYVINNAGTGSRALSTTSVTPDGDISYRIISEPYPSGRLALAMNISDRYFTAWTRRTGRSIVASPEGSKEIAKKTYLRFGQEFNTLAGENLMSTFEALDEQQLPLENGPGTALAEAGEVLVAIHEAETAAVYVGQGFVSTGNGNSFLAKTDNVIGDVHRNLGGHGSRHAPSVVPREGRVYSLDIQRGFIIRRSQDGLTRISDYGIRGLTGALCAYHQSIEGTATKSRIVASWDPQYDCYCLSFSTYTVTTPAGVYTETIVAGYTLYFHEASNSWVCRSDMRPQAFSWVNQKQAGWLAGALYIQTPEANYNKFFGVQYSRTVEFEIAPDESLEKVWTFIAMDVETLYATAGTNEDIVLLYHTSGGTLQTRINYADFVQRGSAWRSSFFATLNDAAFASTTLSKYGSPHKVRGQSAYLTVTYNGTDRNPMKAVTIGYIPSMISYP